MSKAGSSVPAGSTVYFAPGSYAAGVITVNGTSSARTRFISSQKWGAKVSASGSSTDYAVRITGSYVDFEGFDVTGGANATKTFNGIKIDGNSGVGAKYTRVLNNYVHDIVVPCNIGAVGVNDSYYYLASDGYAKSRYNEISTNFINNVHGQSSCSTRKGLGIYISTYKAAVRNNIIMNTYEYGVHLWHAANAATISSNTILRIGVSGSGKGVGIEVGAGDAPGGVVDSNTIVSNNIISKAALYGLQEFCYSGQSCTGANKYLNNLVYASGKSATSLRTGTNSGMLTSSPMLMNDTGTTSGDYHLSGSSPAINKGTSTAAPTRDYQGGNRPDAGYFDIGAYEFGSIAASYPWQ